MGTEQAPRYFRTTKLLFTPRVLCITGRKTRVWEAVEVKGYTADKLGEEVGKPVALKDGWLNKDSRTEGQIQAAIFKRLEGVRDTDYRWAPDDLRTILDDAFRNQKYRDYFMEIVYSRKIAMTKVRSDNAQPKPSILSSPPLIPAGPESVVENSTQGKDRSGLPGSLRRAISEDLEKTLPREYRPKEQHRLVYRDVGYSLHDAKDLSTSFLAIKDTCIGVFTHSLLTVYLPARSTHSYVPCRLDAPRCQHRQHHRRRARRRITKREAERPRVCKGV